MSNDNFGLWSLGVAFQAAAFFLVVWQLMGLLWGIGVAALFVIGSFFLDLSKS